MTQTNTMKLSEAIRIGAAKRPQAREFFSVPSADRPLVGSCALGAAWEAVSNTTTFCRLEDFTKYFPVPVQQLGEIARLNDQGLTREAIADIVQTWGL